MKVWIVRCAVGGSIIGGMTEIDGQPLTGKQARREALRQNRHYRERAQREGRLTSYEFWADSFERTEVAP